MAPTEGRVARPERRWDCRRDLDRRQTEPILQIPEPAHSHIILKFLRATYFNENLDWAKNGKCKMESVLTQCSTWWEYNIDIQRDKYPPL